MPFVYCAPLYKGLVDAEDPASLALITRKDPTTGNAIELDRYVQLVRESNQHHPELVQDIARATTAALFARFCKQDKQAPILVSVEGCEQRVGGQKMTGARIMESIWHSLPSDLNDGIPIRIHEESRCTIQEVRALLRPFCDNDAILGVTHAYHADRVERIFQEERPKKKNVGITVKTPEKLAGFYAQSGSEIDRFIRDVVNAGAPSEDFVRKEGKMERILGPLHTVSRTVEKVIGWNLEMWLANRARKNKR